MNPNPRRLHYVELKPHQDPDEDAHEAIPVILHRPGHEPAILYFDSLPMANGEARKFLMMKDADGAECIALAQNVMLLFRIGDTATDGWQFHVQEAWAEEIDLGHEVPGTTYADRRKKSYAKVRVEVIDLWAKANSAHLINP